VENPEIKKKNRNFTAKKEFDSAGFLWVGRVCANKLYFYFGPTAEPFMGVRNIKIEHFYNIFSLLHFFNTIIFLLKK
jgi:hypothetical protein